MKNKMNLFAAAAAIAAVGLAALMIPGSAAAQTAGPRRIDLQQHDLGIAGQEAVQVRVDFDRGVLAPNHRHPGVEIIYVLRGLLEYQVEGQPAVRLKPGGVLFIPAGKVHSAKNVGRGRAEELATYIVEKGKPLVTIVK